MNPIFIGGCSRSGTTFLGSLLQCIPNSCVTPESGFKRVYRWEEYTDCKSYKKALYSNWEIHKWGIEQDKLDTLEAKSEAEFLEKLVTIYAGKKVDYWIDHTPPNLQYIHHWLDVFPDVKFIHIVRDGRAVANSVLPLAWGENTAMAAAKMWLNEIGFGCAAQAMFPDKVMMVKYEDVVRNPVKEVQRVLDFVGVEKNLKSADDFVFSGDFLPLFTLHQHAFVGKPPVEEFIDKWQKNMTTDQIKDFECFARKMLAILGYEPLTPFNTYVSKIHILRDYCKDKYIRKFINPKRFKNQIK